MTILFLLVVVAGVVGTLFGSDSIAQHRGAHLLAPGPEHLLGTDELNRDLLSRVLVGIRISSALTFIVIPLSVIVGVTLGLIGDLWEPLDVFLQRLFDVLLAFPSIVLGVFVASLSTPGIEAIVVAIFLVNLPIYSRLMRGGMLQQRSLQYVTAAQSVGATRLRVLFRHILPNALDPIIVQVPLSMAHAVFLEGGLSFLGLGIQLPQASLGNVLRSSSPYLGVLPTYALSAIVPLAAMLLAFTLLADSINRATQRR